MSAFSTKRILFTLLLSIAVHAVVLALWADISVVPQAGGHGLTLSLVIQADRHPARQRAITERTQPEITQQASSASHSSQQQTPSTSKLARNRTENVLPDTTPATADRTVTTNEENPPVTTVLDGDKANHKHFTAVLRQAFSAHFYYPRPAIRRGWQGDVQLGMRIEANGQLTHIRILQGSGYGLLDRAALKSLHKVELLPTVVTLLNGKSMELVLPVKYRLL